MAGLLSDLSLVLLEILGVHNSREPIIQVLPGDVATPDAVRHIFDLVGLIPTGEELKIALRRLTIVSGVKTVIVIGTPNGTSGDLASDQSISPLTLKVRRLTSEKCEISFPEVPGSGVRVVRCLAELE